MSLLHTPRIYSNKENSLLSPSGCVPAFLPSSSIAKPVLRGLGRSPRKRATAHGAKPYARTTSVHKSIAPAAMSSKPQKGKKAAHPPLQLFTTSTLSTNTRPRPSVVVVQSQVQIPLTLPRVAIPPVPHLDDDFDANVPFEFVRARLLPRLAAFGIVSSQYRPYPAYLPQLDQHSNRPTMAFGVPAIVEGQDSDGGLAARLHGREPDLCLAITKKGDTTLKATASLVPVNKLVFSSQCFHWSRLTETETSSPPASLADQLGPDPGPLSPELELKPILEDSEEEQDELADVDVKSEVSSELSDAPTITPYDDGDEQAATNSDVEPCSQFPFLHLPLQLLPLPSPETYSHLHNLLHFTHSPPPSTFSPLNSLLGTDIAALHRLDNKGLLRKLAVIQGVWKNCCYLGIGDSKIWNAMSDAWGAVVGTLAERSKKANGMDLS